MSVEPRRAANDTRNRDCVVEVEQSADGLGWHADDLAALTAHALDDNAYMAPEFLLPLLRHHCDPSSTRIVLVRDRDSRELIACAAFSILPPRRRVPMRALSTLVTPHGRLTLPVLHAEHAARAMRALWDWIEAPEHPWRIVLFEHVARESATWRVIEEELRARGAPLLVRETYERPVLRRRASFDAYFAELSSSRRKAHRRHMRELERSGTVTFRVHRDRKLVPDLAERFMAIEEKSWKGDEGTALARSPADRAFFVECVERFDARGALFFVELLVDDVPIAMSTNFVLGRTLFAFKTAYDPAHASCSPGALVEVEGIRHFHDETPCTYADSGSSGSSYVRAFFRDVVPLSWIWVGTHRRAGRTLVRAFPWIDRARKRIATLRPMSLRADERITSDPNAPHE